MTVAWGTFADDALKYRENVYKYMDPSGWYVTKIDLSNAYFSRSMLVHDIKLLLFDLITVG